MSTIEECVRQGRLDEALSALQAAIRKAPADAKYRVLLFQLLVVMGDWERAMTQLNVVGDLDGTATPMVQTYRTALKCEQLRAEVFAGRRTPLLFGEPAQWAALLVQSLVLGAQGKPDVGVSQPREGLAIDLARLGGRLVKGLGVKLLRFFRVALCFEKNGLHEKCRPLGGLAKKQWRALASKDLSTELFALERRPIRLNHGKGLGV